MAAGLILRGLNARSSKPRKDVAAATAVEGGGRGMGLEAGIDGVGFKMGGAEGLGGGGGGEPGIARIDTDPNGAGCDNPGGGGGGAEGR